jgi:hypothetical protein
MRNESCVRRGAKFTSYLPASPWEGRVGHPNRAHSALWNLRAQRASAAPRSSQAARHALSIRPLRVAHRHADPCPFGKTPPPACAARQSPAFATGRRAGRQITPLLNPLDSGFLRELRRGVYQNRGRGPGTLGWPPLLDFLRRKNSTARRGPSKSPCIPTLCGARRCADLVTL